MSLAFVVAGGWLFYKLLSNVIGQPENLLHIKEMDPSVAGFGNDYKILFQEEQKRDNKVIKTDTNEAQIIANGARFPSNTNRLNIPKTLYY